MATEEWETWYSFRPVGTKEIPYRASKDYVSVMEAHEGIEVFRRAIWEAERLEIPRMEIIVMHRRKTWTDWEVV